MPSIEQEFRSLTARLDAFGAEWALVGGLAVGIQVEPRTTRDIDLAVAVADDAEAERLAFELRDAGYEVFSVLEHETSGRLATLRLSPPGGRPTDPVIDLLFASSGIEPEVVAGADVFEVVPGMQGSVASRGHLVALKLLAVDDHRAYDLGDLQGLISTATSSDIETARDAVRLITERGYNRDRDLIAALNEAIERWGEP